MNQFFQVHVAWKALFFPTWDKQQKLVNGWVVTYHSRNSQFERDTVISFGLEQSTTNLLQAPITVVIGWSF